MLKFNLLKKLFKRNSIKADTPEALLRIPKKQRGMGTTDIMIAVVVILGLTAYFGSKSDSVSAAGQEQILVDQISYIIKGMRDAAKTQDDRFESLTCEFLSERNYVNKKWGDCSKANPSGGSYDISDSTVTEIIVKANGLTSDLCVRGAETINKNFNATCSGDTLTVTGI